MRVEKRSTYFYSAAEFCSCCLRVGNFSENLDSSINSFQKEEFRNLTVQAKSDEIHFSFDITFHLLQSSLIYIIDSQLTTIKC